MRSNNCELRTQLRLLATLLRFGCGLGLPLLFGSLCFVPFLHGFHFLRGLGNRLVEVAETSCVQPPRVSILQEAPLVMFLTLGGSLHALRQSRGTTPDTVLVEALIYDQELDQTFDIWGLPLVVELFRLGHRRLVEELTRIEIRPVFGDCVFLPQILNDFLERLVFTDHLQRRCRPDFRDRVAVVAAEEDT